MVCKAYGAIGCTAKPSFGGGHSSNANETNSSMRIKLVAHPGVFLACIYVDSVGLCGTPMSGTGCL